MHYLNRDDLVDLFDIIYKHYTRYEKVPDYTSEQQGIKKLEGVFDGVKSDHFYPDIHSKAAYLFIQINKGHFFSNGNKRLALVCVLFFVFINEYEIVNRGKEEYRAKLSGFFPLFRNFQDYADFHAEEFAYYNLSILVAESEKYTTSFEELKQGVKLFFEFSLKR